MNEPVSIRPMRVQRRSRRSSIFITAICALIGAIASSLGTLAISVVFHAVAYLPVFILLSLLPGALIGLVTGVSASGVRHLLEERDHSSSVTSIVPLVASIVFAASWAIYALTNYPSEDLPVLMVTGAVALAVTCLWLARSMRRSATVS